MLQESERCITFGSKGVRVEKVACSIVCRQDVYAMLTRPDMTSKRQAIQILSQPNQQTSLSTVYSGAWDNLVADPGRVIQPLLRTDGVPTGERGAEGIVKRGRPGGKSIQALP
jgi:hypothetical protein